MNYVEVRLEVNPCSETAVDLLSAFLGEIGFDSFSGNESGVDAYVKEELFDKDLFDSAIGMLPIDCQVTYTVKTIPEQNWNEEWEKNYFRPIVIGNDCVIHSSFHTDVPAVKYDISIDPKMSFGTGHHETTSLMVEMMLKANLKNKTVLDMGCGTGILSILASLMGAQSITSVDIDAWAYENAKENVRINGISNIEILLGGAEQVQGCAFDIVLANINRNILLENLASYAAVMHERAELFMSGFYKDDIPIEEQEAAKHGQKLISYIEKNNWVGTKFQK